MPSLRRRPALCLVVLTVAAALALAGCSSGSSKDTAGSGASSATASPTPSSTVQVPTAVKLTDQGSKLSFGDPAQVIFESTQNKGSVLGLTVDKVQQGRLADFKGFILDDSYKRQASYYYADVTVRNLGRGVLGGVPVPLWGVNDANTLLPPVTFTTNFTRCPSRDLPARFAPGATLRTCLVFLAPNRGRLTALSYRPSQEYDPVTWTGTIAKPAVPTPRKKTTPKKRG